MARLTASIGSARMHAGSVPLVEMSPNSSNKHREPKVKKKSPRKQSDEINAKEAQVTSRGQRLFNLDHVDSMTLPSLNGISAKSFEQGLLAATDDARGRVRATPRRTAKEKVVYVVPEVSPRQGDPGIVDSDWSELEKSQDEDEEEDSELEELRPRALWRSPARELHKNEVEIVDLSSPRKQSTKEKEVTVVKKPRQIFRKSTISDSDSDAILSFSPPRSKSPRKQPPAPTSCPVTPPASPAKSKLTSPTKTQKLQAPPKPHRPSLDSFWSQEVINAWTDEYSPKKILHSPRKPLQHTQGSEDDHTPTPSSPTKFPSKARITPAARAATAAKKAFDANKHDLAAAFLAELDNTITSGSIARLSASTGGVKIIWSNKLNTTAGRANWKCETIRTSIPATSTSTTTTSSTDTRKTEYRHHASIELASKVIDNETRLLNVVAHEYCHLTNFMISRVRDQPHGASFQKWAKEVSKVFGGRGVEVTTKHSYEISYKYAWVCVGDAGFGGCGMEYERHSRSVDPKRHTCGACKGRLVQIRPAVRKAGGAKATGGEAGEAVDGGDGGQGGQSAYQKFVKEQFKVVREELGMKSPMKDVMKEVGARYRSLKGQESKAVDGASSPSRRPTKEKVVEVVVIDDTTDDEVVDDVDELDLPSVLDALTIRDD